MTLDKKILSGLLLVSGILLVVAIISFRNSRQFVETNLQVNQTHRLLYELEQILVWTVNAETSARGFVITGNESHLVLFESARVDAHVHLEKARELAANHPEIPGILEKIQALLGPRIEHQEKYIDIRKKEGFEKAKAFIEEGSGMRLQNQIRAHIANAKQIADNQLLEGTKASAEDTNRFNSIFIALLLIILATLLGVYLVITSNLRALRKAERETAEKNWNLSGSGELVKAMQGNKRVRELSQTIITHLGTYLNAQIGALYVTGESNRNLSLEGTYAFGQNRKTRSIISFNEGIIGQCASDKKTILLTDIKEEYFNIDTGMGEVRPRHVIATPFVFEGKTVGVIALGTIHELTPMQKEFLNFVADSISIAITSAQIREKTKELLEETQRQAEELEAQQEELKQSNEELHAQTELLEKSEALLKTQQEELQQTNIELEEKANMLEQQNEKLEIARHEIETQVREIQLTSRYKSEFLANMSHELRTPLNSILILAQLLYENKNNTLGKKEMEHARNIHSSGKDLLNLINDILDLAKVEAGKVQLDLSEVDIREITDTINSTFSEIANDKDLIFRIDLSETIPRLTTDKQRVEQILKNLLSNAFKFTAKGGSVTLRIDKAPSQSTFKSKTLSIARDVIAFSVSDTGIGIPADKQGIIFEAFQQADGSTKRKFGGTGLGLSISKELALVLGGELQLESEPGRGSTFTLYLPAHFEPDVAAPEKSRSSVKPLPKKATSVEKVELSDRDISDDRNSISENDRVVLIIDDDKQFAYFLLDFVRRRHYKGIISHQGNTGVSYARQFKPDAIVLDMKLPVMDGGEVLRLVKNDPELRHIPVQIISAYDHWKESMELGAFNYLRKPVSDKALHEAFDRLETFSNNGVKKLLIIEDNAAQNQAISDLIGDKDVKCFSAFSGNQAMELMNREKFDCVIVDLGLPDISGFDLLENMKANNRLNRIPIVVYTGKDLEREDNERLNKLADTVVLKTADSKERLLDETILCLHRAESGLGQEKQRIIRKLHGSDEILKGKTILLVDDDIRNIYSLTNALEDEAIHCITAETGKKALEILKTHTPVDLVLMDIMMPEMDGYEATGEIRKLDQFKKLPIIGLTAKAMKGDKEKCLAAGMSDYISKPVNVEQLLSLMRLWLYK